MASATASALGSSGSERTRRRAFRATLRSTGVRLPERQYWLFGGGARYRVDFAWPDLKFGLECEGFEHHSAYGAWGSDRTRYAEIANLGWRVVPVTWRAATRERDRVVRWITNAVPRAA